MKYQNKRGGTSVLEDIKAPAKQCWENVKDAFQDALNLEKDVNQSLMDLHQRTSGKNDASFCDFVESEFLQEQVDSIKSISDYLTNIHLGEGLVFNKELSS